MKHVLQHQVGGDRSRITSPVDVHHHGGNMASHGVDSHSSVNKKNSNKPKTLPALLPVQMGRR